jgi:putative endopeptidase
MNIAYAGQGGLGLPDTTYYFDADKKDRDAYEAHIAKVLELSGVAAADAAKQAEGRDGVRNPPGQGLQVQRGAVARRLAVLQPGQRGRCRQADPELLVDEVLRIAGRGRAGDVLAGHAAFHQEVSKMLADVPTRPSGRATCASTPWMAPRRT